MKASEAVGGRAKEGRAKLVPIVPVYAGLCFVAAFEALLMSVGVPAQEGEGFFAPSMLRNEAAFVVFVLIAFRSEKIRSLALHPRALLAAVACCMLGGGLLTAALVAPLPEFARLAGAACVGAGTAVLRLAWLEFFAGLTVVSVIAHYSISQIASTALVAFLPWLLPHVGVCLVCLALPAISLWCYRRARGIRSQEPFPPAPEASARWTFPYRPVLVMCLFTVANGLVSSYLPSGAKSDPALALCAMYVAFALWAYFRAERFDVRFLLQAALPLATIGPLCIMLGGDRLLQFGSVMTSLATSCFLFFIVVVLSSLSLRQGVNPLWLFGLTFAAHRMGRILAGYLQVHVAPVLDERLVASLLVFVIVLMFSVLLSDKGYDRAWGIRSLSADEGAQTTLASRLDRCAHVARMRGLTRREEEILYHLVQNQGAAYIAAQLFLAESTVKTHVKHIYAKLDVHSRTELIELVDRY